MSKITLTFNLPEEDTEFETAVNGKHLAALLWDFDQWLRNQQKYHNREEIPVDELREHLRTGLSEKGMTFDCVIWK